MFLVVAYLTFQLRQRNANSTLHFSRRLCDIRDLEGVQTSSFILISVVSRHIRPVHAEPSGGRPNYITVPLPNRMKS